MSYDEQIKEVFHTAFKLLNHPIVQIVFSIWFTSLILRVLYSNFFLPKVRDKEDKTVKLLPDSIDSEHTELSECFRDDF